jgi:hypothetical protein
MALRKKRNKNKIDKMVCQVSQVKPKNKIEK